MMMSSRKTIPLLAVVFAACSSGTEPTRPLAGTSGALNNGNGIEVNVNGAGVAQLPGAFGVLKFQFVAKAREDGSANGHFRFFREDASGTHDFEGAVTCVTVNPNFPGRARIGGVVTANNSTAPSSTGALQQVGEEVWFRIQDDLSNGTVAATTVLGFAPTLVMTSAQYCALPFEGFIPNHLDPNGPLLNVWSLTQLFPLIQGQLGVD